MLSKVTFPHTSLLSGGYNFAYDHTRKHTGGVFSRVGIFLTVTPDTPINTAISLWTFNICYIFSIEVNVPQGHLRF